MSRIKSSNPFDEEEEDDGDFVMVNSSRKTSPNAHSPFSTSNSQSNYGQGGRKEWGNEGNNPYHDKRQQLQMQIDRSENNQLESTQRALASIYDSEAMGVATAEELLRQGETLDRIENKTTGIQTTLKTSQRHLNSIKSVFGGLKNWWNGDKNSPSQEEINSTASRNKLKQTVETSEYVEKPKPDFGGFYEDDDRNLDARFMANAPKSSHSGGYTMVSPVTRSAREEELDQNLSLMSDGMSRLKNLAMDLGTEIEQQNEQLDRINLKVENADDLVRNQNTQMRRILKK